MKKFVVSAAVLLILCASSFAAHADYYLKITGVNGEIIKPRTASSDDKLSVTGLPAGLAFKCQLDCDGKTFTFDMAADLDGDGVADRTLDSPSGTAIVSPRDHASGLPTGKRMHKPMVFYCVLMPDGSVSRCQTEAQANAKCTALRESPTQASTGPTTKTQKSWTPCNFRIELKEVMVSSVAGSTDTTPTTSLSINFTKIEMKY